ncbi:cell division protein FtsQ [Chryseobacterium sp. SNU WT5]|uniref:cell division protein FtsQ/DivIB n=1 Tax=Chryseobacterium sp. SNU WT5 TaxID=2594269 RepID=UPI00293930DB|nr:cell division protein FtsQ [Chryseobacterium sp. SNU WT5]
MEKISVKMTKTKNPVYFIDEKEVKELVKKSNPTKKIGDINIPELEKKLNQLPAVDSANVYLNLNGSLNLEIKQRVPAFRLNKDNRDFYVDEKGTEFPTSQNYSFPCMLVMGDVKKSEYVKLAELIQKINHDEFSKRYFIGISKSKDNYDLLTNEGYFNVEIGDLENIDLKVKGFKAFVEKYLIYQQPEKYTKVSVKYDNQIVTTLNPKYKDNDSIIAVGKKELEKLPLIKKKKEEAEKRILNEQKQQPKVIVETKPKTSQPKKEIEKKSPKKVIQKPESKPKGKVKIE